MSKNGIGRAEKGEGVQAKISAEGGTEGEIVVEDSLVHAGVKDEWMAEADGLVGKEAGPYEEGVGLVDMGETAVTVWVCGLCKGELLEDALGFVELTSGQGIHA